MIDEFQDTSRMQWGNFKLLLLEGLSQGADSLIVGDVKQSIYRWRNGDWGILNSLNDHIEHFPIRVKTLATNRRSETNVIRFNNRIFTAAANYLNGVYKQQLGKDCEDLQKPMPTLCRNLPEVQKKDTLKSLFSNPTKNMTIPSRHLLAWEQKWKPPRLRSTA